MARKKKKRRSNPFRPRWQPFEEAFLPPDSMVITASDVVYRNNIYQVNVRYFICEEWGGAEMTHLSIKRNDKKPIHDWRDLQRIKNEICSPEQEAVEIYPNEARLVDTANQYHLWVLPKGTCIPFGYWGRIVTEADTGDGARQRKWHPDDAPADLKDKDEMKNMIADAQEKWLSEGNDPNDHG
jgi:hypothetical protein